MLIRYLYNYSGQEADIYTVSKLLYMSEGYHQNNIEDNNYHKLQVKVLEKNLSKLVVNNTFDFSAADRMQI
jgi:hypothetical protein